MKKTFVGHVPKGEDISQTIEYWDEPRLSMLTLKQWKEILDDNPEYEDNFSGTKFSKRTITITVKDEEI